MRRISQDLDPTAGRVNHLRDSPATARDANRAELIYTDVFQERVAIYRRETTVCKLDRDTIPSTLPPVLRPVRTLESLERGRRRLRYDLR
jgi:hypothetical protein